jgi:hypothetical protein
MLHIPDGTNSTILQICKVLLLLKQVLRHLLLLGRKFVQAALPTVPLGLNHL